MCSATSVTGISVTAGDLGDNVVVRAWCGGAYTWCNTTIDGGRGMIR